MPQGVELATAYVSLAISAEGIGDDIGKELGEPVEREADRTGKESGKKFSSSLGEAASAGMAAAAGMIGFDILVDAFMQELDKAALPAQLEAQFGLAGPAAETAAKTAGDLYAKGWGESLDEVGTSVASVSKALEGLGTGEDVNKLTTQAQALAETFGTDVGEMVTSASQLIKTGLAPDMESAFNIITTGFQSGADSGQDLLDTITEYSVQFSALGLNGATSLGLLNQGLTAGARNSDLVADALKEFSIRAVDGSAEAAASFEALGFNAEEMQAIFAKGGPEAAGALDKVFDALRKTKGTADESTIAYGLFGTQSEDLKDALYALDPSAASATSSFEAIDGAAQDVADTVGGTTQQEVDALGRKFQEGLGAGLQSILPLLTGVINVLQPLAPILGPLALAIGVLAIAQWAWNSALFASPITWIILGVVALVAAIVWLWNNVDGFKQFWVDAWNWILDGIQFLWNWVKDNWPYLLIFLTGPFALIIAAVVIFWDEIVAFFKAGWEWIKDVWQKGVDGAVAIFNWFGELPGLIGGWIGDAVDKGKELLGGFVSFITDIPEDIIDGLSGLADALYNIFKGAFNAVADLWNATIGSWSLDIPSWVPFIGGSQWSVPDIPRLATGGLVKRRPGGVIANIAEGREDEAVTPMSELRAMMQDAYDAGSSDGGRSGGGDNYWTINGYDKSPTVLAAEIAWQGKSRP